MFREFKKGSHDERWEMSDLSEEVMLELGLEGAVSSKWRLKGREFQTEGSTWTNTGRRGSHETARKLCLPIRNITEGEAGSGGSQEVERT